MATVCTAADKKTSNVLISSKTWWPEDASQDVRRLLTCERQTHLTRGLAVAEAFRRECWHTAVLWRGDRRVRGFWDICPPTKKKHDMNLGMMENSFDGNCIVEKMVKLKKKYKFPFFICKKSIFQQKLHQNLQGSLRKCPCHV